MYPTTTPLPDEEPPKPEYGRLDNSDGGDTVPDHGLVGEYSQNVLHQENGGASYRLKHLRSAPVSEVAPTYEQGRLYRAAVPYGDERVGATPQEPLPWVSRDPKPNQLPGVGRSDWEAMNRQVNPGPHPVFFPRGRDLPSDATYAGGNYKAEPEMERPRADSRRIRGALYRPDQRY